MDENEGRAAAASELSAGLGAVLTYTTTGRGGVSGATIGANGEGDWAVLFLGTPEDADAAARAYLIRLRLAGHKVTSATIVTNEPQFLGDSVRVVQASSARLTRGEAVALKR